METTKLFITRIKIYRLNLRFVERIDFSKDPNWMTIEVIANCIFVCLAKSQQDPSKQKIVIFTPSGVQEERHFIMDGEQRYYLGECNSFYVLNSDYFIVVNNNSYMLVSFQTNCVVQQIEEELIYILNINSNHEFTIRFITSTKNLAYSVTLMLVIVTKHKLNTI